MEFAVSYQAKEKCLSIPDQTAVVEPKLKDDIDQLNSLIAEIVANGADVPPEANQEHFNKDLSKLAGKLIEGGVASFKNGKYDDSVRQFTVALEMVCRRHKFEAFAGSLQELQVILMSRTDANLKKKDYLAAFSDIDMLVSMQMNSPDNFLRRGVCNFFLGNYEDARADYQRGLALYPGHARLETELEICLDKILEENGDYL